MSCMKGSSEMKTHVLAAMAFVIIGSVSGCSTTKPTQVTSTPAGAVVTLDGKSIGITPLSVNVSKKSKMPMDGSFSFSNTRDAVADFKRRADSQIYYFVATHDGYMTTNASFDVDGGIPPLIHFDMKPVDAH